MKFGFFRHSFRVCEKKNILLKHFLNSFFHQFQAFCFVIMLDVLVFVKQRKLL